MNSATKCVKIAKNTIMSMSSAKNGVKNTSMSMSSTTKYVITAKIQLCL